MGGCCISRASDSSRNRGYVLINRAGHRVFTLLKPGDRTSRRGTYNLGAGYLRVDNRPDPAKYILVNNINSGIIELDVNREFSTRNQLVLEGNIEPGCWISICWNLALNTDIAGMDINWIRLIIAGQSGISDGLRAHGIQHSICVITRKQAGVGSEHYQLINLGQRLYSSRLIPF